MFCKENSKQCFSEINTPMILFSVIKTSRCMLRIVNPFDLLSEVKFLKYVLIHFSKENDPFGSQGITGMHKKNIE